MEYLFGWIPVSDKGSCILPHALYISIKKGTWAFVKQFPALPVIGSEGIYSNPFFS